MPSSPFSPWFEIDEDTNRINSCFDLLNHKVYFSLGGFSHRPSKSKSFIKADFFFRTSLLSRDPAVTNFVK